MQMGGMGQGAELRPPCCRSRISCWAACKLGISMFIRLLCHDGQCCQPCSLLLLLLNFLCCVS